MHYDEIAQLALRGLDGTDRVRIDIDERLPEVIADSGLLERVVANVVDNALRHGRGSPVTLRASAHAEHVELRIVDAGPGAPEARPTACSPRSNGSATGSPAGSASA